MTQDEADAEADTGIFGPQSAIDCAQVLALELWCQALGSPCTANSLRIAILFRNSQPTVKDFCVLYFEEAPTAGFEAPTPIP